MTKPRLSAPMANEEIDQICFGGKTVTDKLSSMSAEQLVDQYDEEHHDYLENRAHSWPRVRAELLRLVELGQRAEKGQAIKEELAALSADVAQVPNSSPTSGDTGKEQSATNRERAGLGELPSAENAALLAELKEIEERLEKNHKYLASVQQWMDMKYDIRHLLAVVRELMGQNSKQENSK